MKIYISGPITGHPDHMEKFKKAEESLEDTFVNAHVINPAKLPRALPEEGMEYGDYIKVCLSLIDISDMVCMLPGWQESRGARLEKAYAETQEKTIIFQTTERGNIRNDKQKSNSSDTERNNMCQ